MLILLDEPFTGIDPKTIADIQQIVLALRNTGIGVLLTDHNVREALRITTRSYLIKDGKVRTHGTPIEIINDPIAINEYLGVGFNDNVLGGSPRTQEDRETRRQGDKETGRQVSKETGRQEDKETASPVRTHLPEPSGGGLLEHEKIQRLIDSLKTGESTQAAAGLVKKGTVAIPALLAALERRDLDLRRQIVHVLQKIVQRPVIFDPFAPEALRMKQLTALRDSLNRKAG